VNMKTQVSAARSAAENRNRRRSERKPHVADAYVYSPTATDPDDRLEARSINLSRHGVSFEMTRPLASNTFYMIQLDLGAQHLETEVRIISCRKISQNSYQVGAEFC